MRIGILTIELHLGEAASLKDKRRLVKSLLTRLRTRFNVSVAEIEAQEAWQTAILGVVTVANETSRADEVMAAIAEYVKNDPSVELVRYHTEIL